MFFRVQGVFLGLVGVFLRVYPPEGWRGSGLPACFVILLELVVLLHDEIHELLAPEAGEPCKD